MISAMIQTAAGATAPPGQSTVAIRSWSGVDLVYHKDFYYTRGHYDRHVAGCYLAQGKKDKYNKVPADTIRCTEHIKLVIPTAIANTWRKEQKQLGYINLYDKKVITGHADPGMRTHIILIKSVKTNSINFTHAGNKHPVTALFIRHARNVRTYTFKNMKTKVISTLNATANHPFYVKNKKKFVPVGSIASSDTLLTDTGEPVRLICRKEDKKHCGTLYKKGKITTIYNMETYPYHTYFAGNNNHILVHNCSTAGAANNKAVEDAEKNKMILDMFGDEIPQKMAVRFVENPPRREIEEDQWLSLASAQRYKLYDHHAKFLSPNTKCEITGIADYYGEERSIKNLHLIEQDSDGHFMHSSNTRDLNVRTILQYIDMQTTDVEETEKEQQRLRKALNGNPGNREAIDYQIVKNQTKLEKLNNAIRQNRANLEKMMR